MKKLAVLTIVLCTYASSCTDKDTKAPEVWRRSFEPRLSGASAWQACRKILRPGHVVEEAQCGPSLPPPRSTEPCDRMISAHAQAIRILSNEPACTDAAIAALERFARTDAGAMSDVAAAYSVRAQREDRPSDLLRALEASDQALAASPRSPAALFNRALLEETLGLTDESIKSWDAYLATEAHSEWANEARQHRTGLIRQQALDGATQWPKHRERIAAALDARDQLKVAQLIESFPSNAQRYFEDELLPLWAASPSQEQLSRAETFAAALSSRLSGDPFAVKVVDAMKRASRSPATLALLQQGHLAFHEGRRFELSFAPQKAAQSYRRAAQFLTRAGSPLHLRADLGYAVAVSFEPDGRTRALAMLDPIDQQARTFGYRHLLARVESTRAYFLTYQSRYVEALAQYDEALADYTQLRDFESVAVIHTRRIGVLRIAGQHELAWGDALRALRHASAIVEPQPHHVLLGETAATALALGHPRPALLYQNQAVHLFQRLLAVAPPEDLDGIHALQHNLAVALRARAGIEVHLEHHERAMRDLNESIRLGNSGNEADTNIQRAVEARVEEVRGQALLSTNANAAVAAYTRALGLAAPDFRTFRASLYAQRAQAQRLAGRRAAGENDLRAALAALSEEESRILEHRQRGAGEDLWSSYFARFQETYQLLIRQLIEDRRPAEAFVYAERARAFEPLHLVTQLDVVPQETFRPVAGESAALEIARIQAGLPHGTFVIEYAVLDDRTYTWILSRDRFELLTQRARRRDVERWSAALQQAARHRSASDLDAGLFAPFEGLIAAPLAAIAGMRDSQHPLRLLFVPDGAMHGLPLAALRDPRTRRYLIETAPISIAGSTSLYLFSLNRDRTFATTPSSSALVIGDPAFNPQLAFAAGLDRLPRANSEAERVRAVYAPHAASIVDVNATVAAFLEQAHAHDIVHVAAHAIVNASVPSRSLLLLAPTPDHTGALDAEELLTRLKLDRTRLVVLSACSSAGGLPVGPEGVAPLVRPLLAAGVPAVIGSLWDVQDATAEELMVSFHRHYRQGNDAAVALQTAQLEMLRNKNPGLRSVLAWAPFQVIGHASSPFAARATSNGGITLGLHSSNSLQRPDRVRPQ